MGASISHCIWPLIATLHSVAMMACKPVQNDSSISDSALENTGFEGHINILAKGVESGKTDRFDLCLVHDSRTKKLLAAAYNGKHWQVACEAFRVIEDKDSTLRICLANNSEICLRGSNLSMDKFPGADHSDFLFYWDKGWDGGLGFIKPFKNTSNCVDVSGGGVEVPTVKGDDGYQIKSLGTHTCKTVRESDKNQRFWLRFYEEIEPSKIVRIGSNPQVWEGWGTSLAWWAHAVGKGSWEEFWSDLLFTTNDKITSIGFNSRNDAVRLAAPKPRILPGLGLDIVRYNIGGTGRPGDVKDVTEWDPLGKNPPKPLPASKRPIRSHKTYGDAQKRFDIWAANGFVGPWFKGIEGFWKDWSNKSPSTRSFDWNRDQSQRSVLASAVKRGVKHIEFFSNSPMWWMKTTHSAAGGEINVNNLQDFAEYLADVVKHAEKNWGLKIHSLSPFNEPTSEFWVWPAGQEGCNVVAGTQNVILGHLRRAMGSRGLSTAIVGGDENTFRQALNSHHASLRFDRLNVHSYEGLSPNRNIRDREEIRFNWKGNIWSSEYGDGDETGAELAQTILEDIAYLKANAWIYWQVLEDGSLKRGGCNPWGIACADFGQSLTDQVRGRPEFVSAKYFVYAHFTRFIKRGMVILAQGSPWAVVGYSPQDKTVSVVAVNRSDLGQTFAWNAAKFRLGGETLVDRVWTEMNDQGQKWKKDRFKIFKGKLRLTVPPKSIVSVKFSL